VQWSVRIIRSGEYVHAAPRNNGIGGAQHRQRVHEPAYLRRRVVLPSHDGLGDWNNSRPQWQRGGLLPS
jgi:hypothetical protein